ncbi:MAG TPA: hypothetical protein VGT00_12555 [Methylomirabilota bacterium]|jgi:hypothetical protein|nr:hypothetical protein [Methylomirabilota bacterium]
MSVRTIKQALLVILVGALAALASPSASWASFIIDPGFDLFQTQPGTSVGGVPFVGVPLGTFNFGGGPVGTGNTDTIVQRHATAVAPGGVPGVAPPIPIEMLALHLMSAAPTNFGLGVGTYFVTLQSERGGPASTGSLTITFGPEGAPHGTFGSFFDVFFDIRLGSLTGPIALSNDAILTANGVPWSHSPGPGAVEIPGVNTFLNGSDRLADFWSIGLFTEQHPGPPATIHVVASARVPGPSTLLLLVFGGVSLLSHGWRRRTRARP